jgi:hypothetical protein
MGDSPSKGFAGSATGVLSGFAAAATAIAAVVGVLNQFGIVGGHDAPKTIVIAPAAAPSSVMASPVANQLAAVAPSAVPSIAHPPIAAASPRPHRIHKRRQPVEEAAAAATADAVSARAEVASDADAAPAAAIPHVSQPVAAPSVAAPPAASSTLAMIEPSGPININGAWRDQGIGACHLISQSGNRIDVTNFDPSTGEQMGQAYGSIDGNHVEIDYPRHKWTEDLHVARDGQTMYGKITRLDGEHRVMWNYIGPACQKPG